jgi:hypothetical protein
VIKIHSEGFGRVRFCPEMVQFCTTQENLPWRAIKLTFIIIKKFSIKEKCIWSTKKRRRFTAYLRQLKLTTLFIALKKQKKHYNILYYNQIYSTIIT